MCVIKKITTNKNINKATIRLQMHLFSSNKTSQMHKFIFVIKLYMFRTVPLSIIRSFSLYTQQWYMSYRFADSLRAGSGRNSFRPDPDDGQRNCPKLVEFYSKNKFVKLMYLVGFTTRIYRDSRSSDRQMHLFSFRQAASQRPFVLRGPKL